jgi:hypothetical protein
MLNIFQWLNGLLWDYSHIKRGKDETILEFHVRFINAKNKIPTAYRPRNVMVNYAFAFDLEFRDLFWSQKPTNLGQAFLVAQVVEEFLTAS